MSVWRVRRSSVHWSLHGKIVDRWWMNGFGFGSDLAVTPACFGTKLFHLNAERCAPSFSSFQRAFATIVNHDKAFLECHSRTYWCARWTQLQMRQVEWCQWPKAMRCWEKTRAVKVFFSFWNAKYSCLGANPPYARYSIMFLADQCSCRFFLDELFVFAARGEGFDVELVFTYYHKYWLITIFCWHEKQRSPGVYFFWPANIHLWLKFLLEDMVSYPQYITLQVPWKLEKGSAGCRDKNIIQTKWERN